ncbi:ATP-dependent helicase [Arsenicicoccus dermatophilus]|uniref:ATP-dependent helicase n=1 Tax=Arsenicicoccus dermatophilus TaxID=1076331 RepID=UPI0039170F6B
MSPRHSALDIAGALGQPPPTPEQQAVIEAPGASLLVVAGAGSGKTETMSARVVWLVANDLVAPHEVLGLTFTRKAAGELAERIGRRLRQLAAAGLWTGADLEEGDLAPVVSTYHAYAGRLVAEHGLRLGYEPGARLLSEASAWQLAHEVVSAYTGPLDRIARDAGRPVPAVSTVVDAVLTLSGQLAEHLCSPQDLGNLLGAVVGEWSALPPGATTKKAVAPAAEALGVLRVREALVPLLLAYQQAKRERECLDFADQVSLAARIAQTFPDVGWGERRRHRAVLLDEFQDTSEAQLVLLRELFAHPTDGVPVMAVGDPHQSIYGWRGASATTLTSFPRHFPTQAGPSRTLPLSTSWRNDEAVLAVANTVAAPLTEACPVEVSRLSPRPGAGPGRVEAARLTTHVAEAEHAADWLAGRLGLGDDPTTGVPGTADDSGPAPGGRRPTAAVLCRKRSQFPVVLEALEARGVPCEVVGLGGLLAMPEVIDLVAFLHVVDDPARGDHLARLLTGPSVRLGASDLAALHDWSRALGARVDADEDQVGLVEAVDHLPPTGWVSGRGRSLTPLARQRLLDLRDRVRRVRDLLSATLPEVVAEAERVLGLDLEVLARPSRPIAEARVHLDAFADVAAQFAAGADRPTLGALLDWLDAAEDRERGLAPGQVPPVPGAVQVLTVHASKGLEWDLVVVPGLDEGTFPAHDARTRESDDGRYVVPEPTDKTWLAGLDTVPFDLRGDRGGLPVLPWRDAADLVDVSARIGTFVGECGAHAVMEERRLAYVALTRARHELLLSCAVWGHQTRPRVTSRFLEEILAAGQAVPTCWEAMPDPADEPTNPLATVDRSVLWPPGHPVDPALLRAVSEIEAAAERRRDPAETASPAAGGEGPAPAYGRVPDRSWAELDRELAVLLAERARGGRERAAVVTMPAHLSTSALVALADDPDAFLSGLRRPMPTRPATEARRGTAFHAWIERHYGEAAMVDLDELPGSADEGAAEEAELAVMREHFLASEWAQRTPVEVELAVESQVAGVSIRGRIDAVFSRPDGGLTVVDWKTGARPTGRRAQVRQVQLAVYRLALARLRGLDPDQVDGAFYYAATGETVRPVLPDQAELETLVAELYSRGSGTAPG